MKYIINKPLDAETLRKILNQFQITDLPRLIKFDKYYKGKQAILRKAYADESKPCNKIVVNYCKSITDNYQGYLTGIPISYNSATFEELTDILSYNDYVTEDSDYLRNALIYGIAYEITYVDEFGNQCIKVLDSKECIPVYDDTLTSNLKYVIRFYQEQLAENDNPTYIVEVWSDMECVVYKSYAGFQSFTFVEAIPHYYKQVPITVLDIKESIFEQIIGLQDSYNNLISSQVDDYDAFVDAYLVLKGVTADDEDVADMKTNRVLIMDADADASFLTKNANDAPVTNMLTNIDKKIWTMSGCPNMQDESFFAQSGVAIKFKLVGFENIASNIEAIFKKALQRRIELLAEVASLVYSEADWRDVNIVFTRNLPNTLEPTTIQELIQLKGTVSERTLLSLMPFVKDVDEELNQLAIEQEAAMNMYNFDSLDIPEEVAEEEEE